MGFVQVSIENRVDGCCFAIRALRTPSCIYGIVQWQALSWVFEPADDMREACEDPVRAWRLAEFSEKDGESALDTIERERTTMVIDLANPAGDQRSIN